MIVLYTIYSNTPWLIRTKWKNPGYWQKYPETQTTPKKPRSSGKNPAVATLITVCIYCELTFFAIFGEYIYSAGQNQYFAVYSVYTLDRSKINLHLSKIVISVCTDDKLNRYQTEYRCFRKAEKKVVAIYTEKPKCVNIITQVVYNQFH